MSFPPAYCPRTFSKPKQAWASNHGPDRAALSNSPDAFAGTSVPRAERGGAAIESIRSAKTETNLRSGQLFHTQVADPRENNLFQEIADLTIPKLVDFGEVLFGEKLTWMVKEMWTNMLETGGNQAMHSHANSFISGILYLTPSHPASNTVFIRPPGGFEFSFRHHTRSAAIGPYNAGKYILPEANPGDLVLFPSFLYHEVPRNQGEQRMTLAFNAIPSQLDCWGYRITFAP